MLDRTRIVAKDSRLGTDIVDPSSWFEEGMVLAWSAAGWARSLDADAEALRGISGSNKLPVLTGVVIDEPVVFTNDPGEIITLKKANLIADSVKVIGISSTLYVEDTNYTVDEIHGTLTNAQPANTIDEACYVCYTYWRTPTEMEEEVGMPLSNSIDETVGAGKVVVFQGQMRIATTCYDTALTYAVNEALYDNGNGLLTNDLSADRAMLGRVFAVPTAGDVYLIAELDTGNCAIVKS